MSKIRTIAFDADDTLWVNEPIFTKTRLRFENILSNYFEITDSLEQELYQVERRNLELFGYGIKGFMLSMIESALQLTEYRISGAHIEQIIKLGKEMLTHPIEILPGIENTIETLKDDFRLMIITKGDLWDQETKIARSGLAHYFEHVEIVSEKNSATYTQVLNRHGINPAEFLMIGNSLKSDVLPICEIGGRAIHIPFYDTWVHETVEVKSKEGSMYVEMENVFGLTEYLKQLNLK